MADCLKTGSGLHNIWEPRYQLNFSKIQPDKHICIFVCIYISASFKIGFQRLTLLRIQLTKDLLRIYHSTKQCGRHRKIQPKPGTEEYNPVPYICPWTLNIAFETTE